MVQEICVDRISVKDFGTCRRLGVELYIYVERLGKHENIWNLSSTQIRSAHVSKDSPKHRAAKHDIIRRPHSVFRTYTDSWKMRSMRYD